VEGYFGRVLYNYDERYFADASFRRDASSRFAKDNRWGSFWSVGAGWLINKESFFNVSWVDLLKLKVSWVRQVTTVCPSPGLLPTSTTSLLHQPHR
jgi:hypothetical protein